MKRLTVLSTLVLLAGTQAASAQTTNGRTRLGLDAGLAQLSSATVSAGGAEATVKRSDFGFPGGSLGLALGFSLGEGLQLGGRVQFLTSTSDSGSGQEFKSTSYSLLPFLEIMPGDPGGFRPYFGPALGVIGSTAEAGEVKSSSTGLLFGGLVGAHAFVTNDWSIEPSLQLLYTSQTSDVAGQELSGSGYTALLSLGISGWLGGGAAAPAPSAESAAGVVDASEPPTRERAEAPIGSEREAPPTKTPGMLEARADLDDAFAVSLAGEPDSEAQLISVKIVNRGQDSIAECRAIVLVDGEREFTSTGVKLRVVKGSVSRVEVLEARMPAAQLWAWLQGEQLELSVCEIRRKLSRAGRGEFKVMLSGYRSNAQRANTWKTAPPGPVEAPPPARTEATP